MGRERFIHNRWYRHQSNRQGLGYRKLELSGFISCKGEVLYIGITRRAWDKKPADPSVQLKACPGQSKESNDSAGFPFLKKLEFSNLKLENSRCKTKLSDIMNIRLVFYLW